MSTSRGFCIAWVTASLVIALKVTRLTGVSFLIERRLVSASCKLPTDRFPLAIGVGCEDQGVVFFQRIGNRLDVFFAVVADLPLHLKFVVGIDRSVLGRQVPHMAIGGQNRVVGGPRYLLIVFALAGDSTTTTGI